MKTILLSQLPGAFAVFSLLIDVIPDIPILFSCLHLFNKLVVSDKKRIKNGRISFSWDYFRIEHYSRAFCSFFIFN